MSKSKAAILGLVLGAVLGTIIGYMYGVASQTVALGPQHLIGGAIIGGAAGALLSWFLGSGKTA